VILQIVPRRFQLTKWRTALANEFMAWLAEYEIVMARGQWAMHAKSNNGRELSAWLGLVPRQHSSGGRNVLLGISQRGDRYLRTLLIHGARSPYAWSSDGRNRAALFRLQAANQHVEKPAELLQLLGPKRFLEQLPVVVHQFRIELAEKFNAFRAQAH
jgi:hypothetical protein